MAEKINKDLNPTETQNDFIPMTKNRMQKNVAIICTGVFMLYTAFDGPTTLQSTMNKEGNIGVISQSVIYVGFGISAILFPKYAIKRFGSKTICVLSMILYFPYIAGNFFPCWVIMIPASILVGLGFSLFWNAVAIYLNDISMMYPDVLKNPSTIESAKSKYCTETYEQNPISINYIDPGPDNNMHVSSDIIPSKMEISGRPSKIGENAEIENKITHSDEALNNIISNAFQNERIETIRTRLFGIQGMAYLASPLSGSLISYSIIYSPTEMNNTIRNSSEFCGAKYCSVDSNVLNGNLEELSNQMKYTLLTVYVSLAISAILITIFFLEPVKETPKKETFSLKKLIETLKFAKRKELILLCPYTIYIGHLQGFYAGEFTKTFIGCALGIRKVPLITAFLGFCCAASSMSSGWMVKYLGRKLFFSINAVINLSCIITLLVWNPDQSSQPVFFLLAAIWGTFLGSYSSQLKAFYFTLHKTDQEATFAVSCMWMSVGFCFSFAVSGYFCTYMKIYFLLIVSTLGYIGYILVEIEVNKSV